MKRLSALLLTVLLSLSFTVQAQMSQLEAAVELKKHGYVVLWCENGECIDVISEQVSEYTYPVQGLYVSLPESATLSEIVLMELLGVVTGANDM